MYQTNYTNVGGYQTIVVVPTSPQPYQTAVYTPPSKYTLVDDCCCCDCCTTEKCVDFGKFVLWITGATAGLTQLGIAATVEAVHSCGTATSLANISGATSLVINTVNLVSSLYSMYKGAKGKEKNGHVCHVAFSATFIASSLISFALMGHCD